MSLYVLINWPVYSWMHEKRLSMPGMGNDKADMQTFLHNSLLLFIVGNFALVTTLERRQARLVLRVRLAELLLLDKEADQKPDKSKACVDNKRLLQRVPVRMLHGTLVGGRQVCHSIDAACSARTGKHAGYL